MQGVVGARIKKARTELGLSQAAFARALGFSSEFISLLEADKRAPSLATLNKIAAYFNRDIRSFLQEKEGAFNILLRGDALKGPEGEGLDPASQAVLERFKRYCDDYLKLERRVYSASRAGLSGLTYRSARSSGSSSRSSSAVPFSLSPFSPLPLAPLYSGSSISPERLAVEERRRLGLGDEPIRDIFALSELNGCRILRLPIPAGSKLSGAFIYLEDREAAFALVNSADTPGRQAFTAAHEYCHYLKDRQEGPVIENPDVFIDEYVSLYHPREKFAQTFAASFLMPASKVRAIIEKEFGVRRLTFEHGLYLKRYFGVSFAAMLRRLRELGYISAAQVEDFIKRDPDSREREVFGARGERRASAGRPIYSDRYKLLQAEVAKKGRRSPDKGKK
jgi:Zn-dependent peptidase ImmA (M78 family)/transcriptional regulator with XRE-family HTH domain